VNSGTYTIKDGDSYWNISKKVYGTAKYFQVLADYNRRTIADPQKMKAGVAIETPPASILLQRMKTVRRTAPTGLAGRVEPSGRAGSASLSASASSAAESVVVSRRETKPAEPSGILFTQQGYPLYRIGETDTLTSIASDHLGRASRWQQVYNMNRDQLQSPDKLQIGMLLKLPADASRVPLVDHVSSLR
jgi:nucleoid-associated protein YgaU